MRLTIRGRAMDPANRTNEGGFEDQRDITLLLCTVLNQGVQPYPYGKASVSPRLSRCSCSALPSLGSWVYEKGTTGKEKGKQTRLSLVV